MCVCVCVNSFHSSLTVCSVVLLTPLTLERLIFTCPQWPSYLLCFRSSEVCVCMCVCVCVCVCECVCVWTAFIPHSLFAVLCCSLHSLWSGWSSPALSDPLTCCVLDHQRCVCVCVCVCEQLSFLTHCLQCCVAHSTHSGAADLHLPSVTLLPAVF